MIKKGIALYDLHYPFHNKVLWNNLIRFIKDFKPDYFLFGGDNLDMTPVSHWIHESGLFGQLDGRCMSDDYKGFQRDILDELDKILPKNCKRYFMEGNHEAWIWQAINKTPSTTKGILEIENNLDLSKWKWIDYGKHAKIGKICFIHGVYTNEGHAKKTVTIYNRNIRYGHNHTFQAHTATVPLDNESHTALAIPCACDLNPDYARNKPNAWLSGFQFFYLKPSGDFNDYIVVANKGNFIVNGVNYE